MKLEWLPAAQKDFDEIVNYIAQDSRLAAIEHGDGIVNQLTRLISHPKMGRSGRVKATREQAIARTPCIAAYRIRDNF